MSALFMWLMSSVAAFAGTINGVVRDKCGDPVNGVTVVVAWPSGGQTYEQYVHTAGEFNISLQDIDPVGEYKVYVKKANDVWLTNYPNSGYSVVKNENGTVTPSVTNFTIPVENPQVPNFTLNNGTNYYRCNGTGGVVGGITLTNASTSSPKKYRLRIFNSANAEIYNSGEITTLTTVNIESLLPTNALGNYRIELWVDDNCGQVATDIKTMNFNISGVFPITVSGVANVCAPATETVLSAPPGLQNYQWSFAGFPITDATNATFTATQSGTYSVTATSNGCAAASGTYTVTINPAITGTLVMPNNNPVAISNYGFSPNINITSTGAYTYNWSVSGVTTQSITGANTPNPTFTFNAGGTATVSVTVSAGTCTQVFSQTVTVVNGVNCNLPSNIIILGNPTQATTYTGSLPGSTTLANNYFVAGDITLSGNIEPTASSVFYMNGVASRTAKDGNIQIPLPPTAYTPDEYNRNVTGTYITVTNGLLKLKGVTFRAACNVTWGGIIVNSTGKIQLLNSAGTAAAGIGTNSSVQNSLDGVVLLDNTFNGSTIARTDFLHNIRGIQFKRSTNNTSNVDVVFNASAPITRCNFNSNPANMLYPFDFLLINPVNEQTRNPFVSFSHVSNTNGVRVRGTTSGFFNNTFNNALYGVFLENHGFAENLDLALLLGGGITFNNCHIAAIWHTNGNVTVQSVTIRLPLIRLYSAQIHDERVRQNLEVNTIVEISQGFVTTWGKVYGIYAKATTAAYSDLFEDLTTVEGSSPAQEITDSEGNKDILNEVGYCGWDTKLDLNPTLSGSGSGSGIYGRANTFLNLRTGVLIEGTIDRAQLVRSVRFEDNLTAIHINRTSTTATNVDFTMQCSDFVSTPTTPNGTTYLPRTALRLTGNGVMNVQPNNTSILGGCFAPARPNGNEIRNKKSDANVAPIVMPLNFTFINSTWPQITYSRYRNENVNSVLSTIGSVDYATCNNLPDANDTTCSKTAAGVANRQGQGDTKPAITEAYLGTNAPNPADGEGTNIAYRLPEGVRHAELKVMNYLGNIVHSENLVDTEGNVQLNTEKMPTGAYIYTLVLDGRVVKSHKMRIIK